MNILKIKMGNGYILLKIGNYMYTSLLILLQNIKAFILITIENIYLSIMVVLLKTFR